MFHQQLRKVGNSFVVTIPKDVVDRLQLSEGQFVSLEVTPMELRPVLSPELKKAFLEDWETDREAYLYLADH